MKKKYKIIREVFENYNKNNYKIITIFTKSFKATGEYNTTSNIKELVTLKNAKIYSYATNCECETTSEYKEANWLNIFTKDITAFSFVENY